MDGKSGKDAQLDKSLWKENGREIWSFFCPLCRSARRLPYRPQPGGLRHYAQIGLTAAFFTLATWQWFSWKGIVSFVPLWAIFETFYRWRTRAALACRSCGFDAFLYVVDVPRARAEVEAHWRKKFSEKGISYPGDEAQQPQPQTPP